MYWIILAVLIILVILIAILLNRIKSVDYTSKFDAALKEQFLSFQSNIHKELNTTREEVSRSKDLISQHTIKTIDTMKDMGETIHKIIQQQEEAQKLGQSLKDILHAPKLRGSYGEAILEEMLDRVLPKGIWEKQYSIEKGNMVDVVIKMKDTIIPIDAKFSRDDYLKYIEASEIGEKEEYWKSHEAAVKTQIKSIKSKYIKPEKGTSDFALMFIPSEAIYYETIAEKNFLGNDSSICKVAEQNNVIPVSPNTFYAFLQVIVMSIRNIEIIKSAKILQENLSTIQRSFDLFYKKYVDIGKHLKDASEAFRVGDSHIDRYKKKLDSTLQLEELHGGEVPPDKQIDG
ncbi:DNA recombination protein RmuC [Elusimicrobiota bacterium]